MKQINEVTFGDNLEPHELQACMDAWQAGEAWANGLKAGDIFNGTMGEAKLRYTSETLRSMFDSAAWIALKGVSIWCENDSNVLTKVERR